METQQGEIRAAVTAAAQRFGDSDLWLLYVDEPRLAKAHWANRVSAQSPDLTSFTRMRDCLRPELPFTRAANLYGA